MSIKKLPPLLLCVLALEYSLPSWAAEETGAWSKAVNGVQGRLIVSEGSLFYGTQMPVVYLELRNVSDVANPLEVYYPDINLKGTVVDKQGKKVPPTSLSADIMRTPPYWLVLPYDGRLRFRISVTGYGVPQNGGVLLGLNEAWLIRTTSNAPYFLQGTFSEVKQKDSGTRRQWLGTVQLPNVKIPLTSSKPKR